MSWNLSHFQPRFQLQDARYFQKLQQQREIWAARKSSQEKLLEASVDAIATENPVFIKITASYNSNTYSNKHFNKFFSSRKVHVCMLIY